MPPAAPPPPVRRGREMWAAGVRVLRGDFEELAEAARMTAEGDGGKVPAREWHAALQAMKATVLARYFGKTAADRILHVADKLDREGAITWEAFAAEAELSDSPHESAIASVKIVFDSLRKDIQGRAALKEWKEKFDANVNLMTSLFGSEVMDDFASVFAELLTAGPERVTWADFSAAAGLSEPATGLVANAWKEHSLPPDPREIIDPRTGSQGAIILGARDR